MRRKRAVLQRDLFSNAVTHTAYQLPSTIRVEVVQLLERLLCEVMQAQFRHGASPEAHDEQDQR